MNWKQSAVILGIVGSIGIGVVMAQTDFYVYDTEIPEATGSLTLTEAVTGELTEDTPIFAYTLELGADDSVQINVDFEDVDGYLLVADESGEIIAYNDDGAGIYNSLILPFRPGEAGTYTVAVTSLNYVLSDGDDQDNEGSFTLTAGSFELTPAAVGDAVEGELTGEGATLYGIELEAGQLVTLNLDSEAFDPRLSLLSTDQENRIELSNDDANDTLNSQIGPYLITEAGTYIVRASAYDVTDAGEYTLTISASEADSLTLDESSEGSFTGNSAYVYYRFEGTQGQQVDVTVTNDDDLDLMLSLYGPDYALLVENDDEDGSNPGLVGFELPADGTYTIAIYPFLPGLSGGLEGSFEITVGSDAAGA